MNGLNMAADVAKHHRHMFYASPDVVIPDSVGMFFAWNQMNLSSV